MTGRTNAVPSAGGAEAVTGKIPASSGFSRYSFSYTNINGELIQLYHPSEQTVQDVCKNTFVICSYNSAGSNPRAISNGGFSLSANMILLSSEASRLFGEGAATVFFVTGDFEIV